MAHVDLLYKNVLDFLKADHYPLFREDTLCSKDELDDFALWCNSRLFFDRGSEVSIYLLYASYLIHHQHHCSKSTHVINQEKFVQLLSGKKLDFGSVVLSEINVCYESKRKERNLKLFKI